MSDKTAKMLERVRALLAKAASTTFPEEADAFRAKADEIMSAYAIDQWMVDEAQAGRDARPVPEKRLVNFDWWRGNPFRDQLWWMFSAVGRHCRCRVVVGKVDYSDMRIPVIGLGSDLDWFDLLFTNLMIAMIQKVDPQPVAAVSVNENMAMMREAGLPWVDGINRLVAAGIVDGELADGEWRYHDDKRAHFSKAVYERTIRGYRAWCKKTGHPQSLVNQKTFRRNFADGFAAEVTDRLYRMRRESERAYDADHETGSMALAVRDIREVINEFLYNEYPDLRPHPRDCDCDKCHSCQDPKCQRANCVAARKPIRVRSRRERGLSASEYAAQQAGRAAGRTVDLANNSDRRVRSTPEIGGSK